MKNTKNIILSILITLVGAFIAFYIYLPPLNFSSFDFWFYLIFVLILYTIVTTMFSLDFKGRLRIIPKEFKIITSAVIVIIAGISVINVFLSPLFQSNSYATRITVNENSSFTEDVKPVDFTTLPLLDKSSSTKLGDRVMGQMPELVSQFSVSNLYTQINYNNEILRVTPLEYNGIIKYFTNRNDGVKGYITVDSVTGSANLIKLEKGMKYMPSALFQEDLMRHVRFQYLTEIFGEISFEIDNDGNPYWIIPTLKYKGVNIMKEISGVIIVDPITGKSQKYDVKDVPTWVDHVYSADLIIEQVNNWGTYREGFINSIFGQKNVVTTTEGYNYTVMNDDVYLYTGITSVSSDESNLGFILTNMRTKETNFYSAPGAEEYSAMASAEGQVQQMNYIASFPLLINLNNKPTYLMSLKDNAGLVKMYAFVDVANYQKVVVTDSSKGIEQAAKNYLDGENVSYDEEQIITKKIKIDEIKTANIDGTSYYYIVDSNNKKYRISIKIDETKLPFIKKGDSLEISYIKEEEVTEVIKIK